MSDKVYLEWEEHGWSGDWIYTGDKPNGVLLVFITAIDHSTTFRWFVFMNDYRFATGQRNRLKSAQKIALEHMHSAARAGGAIIETEDDDD